MRDAIEGIGRAVEVVDVPADATRALRTGSFLRNDRVVGSFPRDGGDDRALSPFVGFRDEIGGARLGTNAGRRRTPKVEQQRAGLSVGVDRQGERVGGAIGAHARCAPGLPSSTTKVAVVLTVAVVFLTVDTARKSAVSR